MATHAPGSESETEKERIDRELIELLNELRVMLPGVQVLFAFLLILPFSAGFESLDAVGRDAFIASLVCATISTILLITPSAYHRLRFRDGDKKRMLFTSNRLAVVGLAFLALAMSLALLVILRVVVGSYAGYLTAGVSLLAFAGFWYILPLSRKIGDGNGADRDKRDQRP